MQDHRFSGRHFFYGTLLAGAVPSGGFGSTWIRSCKGGAAGVSEFAVATKYIEWLSLGAIALRVPGKLMWDANKRRFSNNEEANRLLKPFLRKGWELKA